jgi:hypothetical protein
MPGATTCTTFSYSPAPSDSYRPSADYATLDEFKAGIAVDGKSICTRTWNTATAAYVDITCAAADCDVVGGACATCCATYRTHKVVRGMMALNGTSAEGVYYPIPADKVLGFVNATTMDKYLIDNPETIKVPDLQFSLFPLRPPPRKYEELTVQRLQGTLPVGC